MLLDGTFEEFYEIVNGREQQVGGSSYHLKIFDLLGVQRQPAEVGPIVAPGNYSVRLKIGDQTYTQPVSVARDPRSPGSDADIDLSVKTQLRIREDISGVSDRVNQMEWVRKQLEVVETMLRPPKKKKKEKPPVPVIDGEIRVIPEQTIT